MEGTGWWPVLFFRDSAFAYLSGDKRQCEQGPPPLRILSERSGDEEWAEPPAGIRRTLPLPAGPSGEWWMPEAGSIAGSRFPRGPGKAHPPWALIHPKILRGE